ncbi:MAG: hypothetical protein ACE1Y9_03405 [Acidimicrobiia bacterium]
MRGHDLNRSSVAAGAVIVGIGMVVAACSSAGSESQGITEDSSSAAASLIQLEDDIARLSDQLAGQSEEITALQALTSELDREIASVRESVEAIGTGAASQEISARLSAAEAGIADHAEMLGWKGNYADGLWADMEAVLDCLDEIVELGGVPLIANNSCRLIDAGMMGG